MCCGRFCHRLLLWAARSSLGASQHLVVPLSSELRGSAALLLSEEGMSRATLRLTNLLLLAWGMELVAHSVTPVEGGCVLFRPPGLGRDILYLFWC